MMYAVKTVAMQRTLGLVERMVMSSWLVCGGRRFSTGWDACHNGVDLILWRADLPCEDWQLVLWCQYGDEMVLVAM